MLTLRRAWLQQSVIHTDVLALGVEFAKVRIEAAGTERGSNLLQVWRRLRQMFAQRVCQSARAPQEHAAVPKIISRLQKFLGTLDVGLLGEAMHAEHAFLHLLAGFDVAVSSLGARRVDAHHHHVLSGRSDLDSLLQNLAKALLISD